MELREATAADADAIAAIYRRHVETGTATFDTTSPPIGTWLDKIGSSRPGDHFLVVEDEGGIAGFAYSSIYRPRAAYDQTREVTVYLADGVGGRGLGRLLYGDLLARLRADGMHTALAVIATPNPASVGLHESFGFRCIGVMEEVGRKFDRWIDVGFWQLML